MSTRVRATVFPIAWGAGLRAGRIWASEQATFAELQHLANERDCQGEVDAPFLAGFYRGALEVWDEVNGEAAEVE